MERRQARGDGWRQHQRCAGDAAADVGIAMDTGTVLAMLSAQLTRVKGELRTSLGARAISTVTVRITKQNLAFTFPYSALGILIAAGVLYPVSGLLLSPMVATSAITLSSVPVITNVLRLAKAPLAATLIQWPSP